jgi:hypothetical protein
MYIRYFQSPEGWVRRVPAGFSWLAFFFGATWAFANRAWLLGVVVSLVTAPLDLLHYAGNALPPSLALAWLVGALVSMFLLGRYGHAWLAWSLKRQGYAEIQIDAV